jgi:hypothetical protein
MAANLVHRDFKVAVERAGKCQEQRKVRVKEGSTSKSKRDQKRRARGKRRTTMGTRGTCREKAEAKAEANSKEEKAEAEAEER